MDQTDQTTQPVTPETNTQTVVEKKQFSTLWVLLILVLAAIALAIFVSATSRNIDNTVPAPYTEETMGDSIPVPDAGENPEATAEESAAIRSDLEMNSFDGTSEGI